MKNRNKNFIISMVVYPFDVMVSLGQTDKELTRDLEKVNHPWHDGLKVNTGRFYLNDDGTCIIRLKKFPVFVEDYGVLQHEIFHCVTFLLDRVGLKFKLLQSDEAYSYLVGYLTTEIYKKINQST